MTAKKKLTPKDQKKLDTMPVWKQKLHEIIFEAETPAGRLFDVALLAAIIASVLAVMIESVDGIGPDARLLLRRVEWGFTILFTAEYILRLLSVVNVRRYAVSFFGIIDLISILPTYLSLFLAGTQSFLVVRSLRLLRVFRVLKLARTSLEAEMLMAALRASRPKITVFIGAVFTVSLIMGTLMYLIEGESGGIPDIPTGVYWAIMTITTVGYGDIAPHTPAGRCLTTAAMILGYGLIAVPTGIVSVELAHASRLAVSTTTCPNCHREGHDQDAVYCRFCGAHL